MILCNNKLSDLKISLKILKIINSKFYFRSHKILLLLLLSMKNFCYKQAVKSAIKIEHIACAKHKQTIEKTDEKNS